VKGGVALTDIEALGEIAAATRPRNRRARSAPHATTVESRERTAPLM
jgi:hypothetical protein